MWKSKQIANIVLLGVVGIFLGTYPFRDDMLIGFFWHVSGAAMIGGLADWYAVTALFGKPLGISYKTNVIPRSREKLISMAHHMVMKELLTTNHIYRVAKSHRLVESLLHHFLSAPGREWLRAMREQLNSKAVENWDLNVLFEELKRVVKEGISGYPMAPLILVLLKRLISEPTWSILWKYVNRMVQEFIASPMLEPYMMTVVGHMMTNYKESSLWRELALSLVDTEEKVEEIVRTIRKRSIIYLESQEESDSDLSEWTHRKVEMFLRELAVNATWQEKIEIFKMEWIDRLESSEVVGSASGEELFQSLLETGEREVISYLEGALVEEKKRVSLERFFLYQLRQLLDEIRPRIEVVLLKELDAYSAQEISELVRDKVYYDLQMVRINGSLVGGLLGGVFYILHMLVSQGVHFLAGGAL